MKKGLVITLVICGTAALGGIGFLSYKLLKKEQTGDNGETGVGASQEEKKDLIGTETKEGYKILDATKEKPFKGEKVYAAKDCNVSFTNDPALEKNRKNWSQHYTAGQEIGTTQQDTTNNRIFLTGKAITRNAIIIPRGSENAGKVCVIRDEKNNMVSQGEVKKINWMNVAQFGMEAYNAYTSAAAANKK